MFTIRQFTATFSAGSGRIKRVFVRSEMACTINLPHSRGDYDKYLSHTNFMSSKSPIFLNKAVNS